MPDSPGPGTHGHIALFFHLGNVYEALLCARLCKSVLLGEEKLGIGPVTARTRDLIAGPDTQETLGSQGGSEHCGVN